MFMNSSWRRGLRPNRRASHSNTQAMFSHVEWSGGPRLRALSPPVEGRPLLHTCALQAAKSLGPDISLPSKPCRKTTALSLIRRMPLMARRHQRCTPWQCCRCSRPKLLQTAEGGVLTPEATKDLRAATDFALMATKRAAQSVGKAMGFMVVLQRHLWLNLADLKDADRKVLLNAPISPSGLFGDAVETITERFAETQKRAKRWVTWCLDAPPSNRLPDPDLRQRMALPSGEIFPGLPRLGLLLLLLDRSQTSGGRCGAPAGSAKVSGEARDAILARPRLLSRLPDDRREGGERESSPAPKRPKFQLPKCVCVECPFNKNAYFLTKRAFSSSLNKCGSPCPASVQCRSASNTGL